MDYEQMREDLAERKFSRCLLVLGPPRLPGALTLASLREGPPPTHQRATAASPTFAPGDR